MRGSLAGLTLALAFSVLVNVLVLATLVWPAWLETRLKFACATAALGLWVAALWETRGELRRLAAERDIRDSEPNQPTPDEASPNDPLLREAQESYLRGDWVGAERRLRTAIRQDRDDFESRFWLVSVLRASGRCRQAERLLRRVERLDAAAAWRHEVRDEHARIAAQRAENDPDHAEEPTILPIRGVDPNTDLNTEATQDRDAA